MIETIMAIPALIKIMLTLVIILTIYRFFKNLTIAVGVGAAVVAVWLGHSLSGLPSIAYGTITSRQTIGIIAVMQAILILSQQMRETNLMKDLVSVVRTKVSRRNALVALPAIVGLLPMPGGALFSAPMIADCDENGVLCGNLKAKVNHWFRHLSEFWWPLYPGVLLAIEQSPISLEVFVLGLMPMSLIAYFGGRMFLLTHIPRVEETAPKADNRSILSLTYPIWIVVLAILILRAFGDSLTNISRQLPIAIGLCFSILAVQLRRPLPKDKWKPILWNSKSFALFALVVAILIYKDVLKSPIGNGEEIIFVKDIIKADLTRWQIPMLIIIMTLPFLCGLATGITIGFVGVSFPIVMPLIAQDATLGEKLGVVVLAYSCGYIGMMLSPLHVCLIVSKDFFETQLSKTVKGLVAPSVVVLIGGLLLYFAYSSLIFSFK